MDKRKRNSCQMLNRERKKMFARYVTNISHNRYVTSKQKENVKESHSEYVFYEMRVIIDMRKYKYSFRIFTNAFPCFVSTTFIYYSVAEYEFS